MGSANYIYSLSSVAAFLRCEKVSPDLTKTLLNNINLVFTEDSTSNSEYLYNLFKSNKNLNNTDGFTRPEWTSLEARIYGNLQAKIGISSFIYCFSIYSNLEDRYKEFYINKLYSKIYNDKPPKYFTSSEIKSLIEGFSISNINKDIEDSENAKTESKIVNYNYYDASPLFANPESNSILRRVIKDAENQYYYLAGELIYDYGTKPNECQENIISVTNSSGTFPIKIYQNLPCFEKGSFSGPINEIKFFRIFNDGPPSSGYFDQDTMDSYIQFDENISNKLDYSSNNNDLYSFVKDDNGNYIPLKLGVQLDAQGSISSSGEYGNERTNWITDVEGCRWTKEDLETLPLMRMHQGDNLPKYNYYKIKISQDECLTGINGPLNWTGWKFVNFELKDSWLDYFKFINTNPRSDGNRILKRALNIENYLDTSVNPNEIHSPYLGVSNTGDQILICNDYVGPPQLNNNYSTLPGFAFYQTFDNYNFGTGNSGEYSTISIHPAFSKSNSVFKNSKSNRSIEVSKFPIFSGKIDSHNTLTTIKNLPINFVINSSSMSNYDEIFKKTIGIGDNFNNQVSGSSPSEQENAGYFYTGYRVFKNGEEVSLGEILSEYLDKKVGAQYSEVKYIDGYLNTGENKSYLINPLTAHFYSGNSNNSLKTPGEYIVYYYFNTETGEGSLMSVNTGWIENFAPIPQDVNDTENENKYTPIYKYQKVENYFPRYYSGPFASYENKFLYPNAYKVYKNSNLYQNGFPNKISYVINFREENAREIFASSGFYNSITYKNVIRANNRGEPFNLGFQMIKPFVPYTSNQFLKDQYDYFKNTGYYFTPGVFNNNTVGAQKYRADFYTDLVDAFYVPSIDYCIQDNLNNRMYKKDPNNNSQNNGSVRPDDVDSQELGEVITFFKVITHNSVPTFVNGIKTTGMLDRKKIKTIKNTQIIEIEVPFINNYGDPLHWGYMAYQLTGNMLYVPPLFDLSLSNKNVSQNLKSIIDSELYYNEATNISWPIRRAYSNNGFILDGNLIDSSGIFSGKYNGKDPIFYQQIGGRKGEGSELEGGYHNKGIIGDSWYGLNFGNKYAQISHVEGSSTNYYLFWLSFNGENLSIKTNNLFYYPYYSNFKYSPFFNGSININGLEDVNISSKKINDSEYYYNFNLKDLFPLKSVSSFKDTPYYESGITIGPFSKDVEFCVLSGNAIIPSGNLYIDEELIAGKGPFSKTYLTTEGNYYNNTINYFNYKSGIIPGGRRNPNLTTFKLIPSGKTVKINVLGKKFIGFEKNAIVTIRPRTAWYGVNFYNLTFGTHNDFNILSGDYSFLESNNFIDNETQQDFNFPANGDIKNLIGKKFEYITKPNITNLFPVPDPSDFDSLLLSKRILSYDLYGNKIYNTKNGPTYEYWRYKNPDLIFDVLRDTTRVSFEIKSIDVEYGDAPYQSQKVIIPSGNCRVSGVFGYTGQAESAILSQGLYLTGLIRPRVLENYYVPLYVSDVLKRIPKEIEVLPSGSGKFIVLEAPSYLKRRKDFFTINGEEIYENYTPIPGLNYNKFIWPALSDLTTLNPDISYETLPPEDDIIFPNSNLFFSASQGQILFSGVSGLKNPNENVTYKTKYLYSFVDTTATNSIYNTGKCIRKEQGSTDVLTTGNLSGILTSEGIPISLKNKFSYL